MALGSDAVHVNSDSSVRGMFNRSLNKVIRDIEGHPRGQLTQRLIRFGPPDPDDPELLVSDGETTLSDPECGLFVDFIHSFMISHFKGELAELLALDPCIRLLDSLKTQGRLPANAHLYWGDQIQERRRRSTSEGEVRIDWGGFTNGADGLIVSRENSKSPHPESSLTVHGIIEVKSYRSVKPVLVQIERHKARLAGGVRLGSDTWLPNQVNIVGDHGPPSAENGLLRITVFPSKWRLSRQWKSRRIDERSRVISMEEISDPLEETRITQAEPNNWRITLVWSEEALAQAAYQLTLWYLALVGAHVFASQPLPRAIDHMTPKEAGINQIKYRLYVIGLRYVSKRQTERAMRLYNDYAFGSPLAFDAGSEMIWSSDFPHDDDGNGSPRT